ncbi:MAG: YHS domain-containing protein [Flavobacteriaceae bacterium]|nr:MAG: YHS domain-containing protein [Flavobacteriaceae bacterium]
MKQDPVCRMEIDEKDAAASLQYDGKIYFFCAESCRDSLTADPKKYNDPKQVISSHGSLKLASNVDF